MSQAEMFSTEAPDMRGQLTTLEAVKNFALAGNATITIRSEATGTRFTFKIRKPKQKEGEQKRPPIWFVSLMTGSDNENNFEYMGQIYARGNYGHGKKARINTDAPAARAFAWFWNMVNAGREDLFESAAIWHEGRCGRCNRKLTVPESVESGFGPECINMV